MSPAGQRDRRSRREPGSDWSPERPCSGTRPLTDSPSRGTGPQAPLGPSGRRATSSWSTVGGTGASRLLSCRPSDRKSTRLNSSHVAISYAVFCLKKKNKKIKVNKKIPLEQEGKDLKHSHRTRLNKHQQ